MTARLGPFQLAELLASGGLGTVWRATHSGGVEVAVKVLSEEGLRDREAHARFRTEMRAVAGLDHPGILLLFDHGIVSAEAAESTEGVCPQGAPYLVMELARGGSLAQIQRPYMWSELRGVLVALLDVLAHAHARGVIHRDLKPHNVLLSTLDDVRPGLKLADFGIAHAVEDAVRSGSLIKIEGTLHYMAPEQILGNPRDFGPWTDLYGLGCLAYHMCSGAPPFAGLVKRAALRAHFKEQPAPLEPTGPVPPRFREWVGRLMAKDPGQRFQTAADAAWALVRLGDVPDLRIPAPDQVPYDSPDALLGAWTAHSSTTTLLLKQPDITDPDLKVFHGALPADAPQVPMTWRRPTPPRPSLQLVGAGLGLFGLRSIPMVGREAERDVLWDAYRAALGSHQARLVLARGPAGVGKTRLCDWICERALELGTATVLRAGHAQLERPGSALRRMFATHLRTTKLDRREALEQVEDFLLAHRVRDPAEAEALTELVCPAHRNVDGDVSAPLGTAAERYATARRCLRLLAQVRPLIVFLDDVHWGADALGLVASVLAAQASAPFPVLFLLTARDEELAHPTVEQHRLRDILEEPGTRTLHLGPLEQKYRYQLIQEVLLLEEKLGHRVLERTQGNPQFAVQLIGDWVAKDQLEVGPEGFRLKGGEATPLPDDVHHLWRSRVRRVLKHLPEADARPLLELAAVLGARVDHEEWQEASDYPEDPSEQVEKATRFGKVVYSPRLAKLRAVLLDRLLAFGLAVETDDGWAFAHEMVRGSLERSARESGRWVAHHRACAAMLERRAHRGLPQTAERLGRHLLAAGELARALAPLTLGVQERKGTQGYRPALDLLATCEQAMDALELPESDPRWGELFLTRGSLLLMHGDLDGVLTWSKRAAHAADQHGWTDVLYQALFQLAQVHTRRRLLDKAESVLVRLRRELGADGDPEMRAKALFGLAAVKRERRQLMDACVLYTRARLQFLACGQRQLAAACWRDMAACELAGGRVAEGAHLYAMALEVYEATGNRHEMAHCVNGMAEVARARGDVESARIGYERALELLEAVGGAQAVVPRLNLALLAIGDKRYEHALELAEVALADARRLGRPGLLAAAHGALLACAGGLGEWATWDVHIRLLRRRLADHADRDIAWCARVAGDIARGARQKRRAAEAYGLALAQMEALGDPVSVRDLQERVASVA